MREMYNTVYDSINVGDKLLLGISGGADSMVLLDIIRRVKEEKNFSFFVVHVEHGIRGEESKNDARFVQEYCKQFNIDCKVEYKDIPKLAKKYKQTIEQCARNERYNIFNSLLPKEGKLVLAHHMGDQAETVLMHIFRGSGIEGATGIASNNKILRPLLNFSKSQILEYAKLNNIRFVEDSTNNDTNYTRNFIRNEILPKLEEFYPKVTENLCKFAFFCRQAQDFIESSIKKEWIQQIKNGAVVSGEVFGCHPVQINKIIKIAYNLCGEWADLESKHIDIIKNFYVNCKSGATLNLPHGILCEKRKDKLYFVKNVKTDNFNLPFSIGKFEYQGSIITSTKVNKMQGKGQFLDLDKLPNTCVWRTRLPNDTFAKLGSGSKKLNDYFTDKKIPKPLRDNVLLLADGNKILLVLGYDISDNAKIDNKTKQIVCIVEE